MDTTPKFITRNGFPVWPDSVGTLLWKVRPTVGIDPEHLTRKDAREAMTIATGLWEAKQSRFHFAEAPDTAYAHILVGEKLGLPDDAIANSELPHELGFCNITLNLAYKFAVDWRTWFSLYDLPSILGHELGHAMGLSHVERTSRAIMYPRNNGERYRKVTKADVAYFQIPYPGSAK